MSLATASEIRERWPDLHWPYSPDGTQRLVRLGRLGCVRVGRNVFFTRELIETFIREHTVQPAAASTVQP